MLRTEHDERRVMIDVQDEVPHPMEAPPGVVSACEGTGKEYFFTPGELLVAAEDLQRVLEFLREGNIRRPLEITAQQEVGNVVRLTVGGLDDAVSIPRLVEELRNLGPKAPVVGPNHFFFGQNHVWWHSAEPPNPAASREPIPDRENLPGRGTLVAVLDTGARNPWFPATVSGAADPVTEAPDGSLAVDAGHGTFVTGVVLQYAPGAEVVVVRVLNDNNFSDEANIAQALLDLPGNVDVVNLSLGGYTAGDTPPVAIESALETLRDRNPDVVVVASAGNDSWNRPAYPAALKGVIGVAALDARGFDRAPFSNFGPWVDAAAPGQDVNSSFLYWDGLVQRGDGLKHDFDGWATWSGTSFAAPAVTGAIAALASTGLGASTAAHVLIHGPNVHRRPGLGAILDPPVFA
jgi:hypothetical protein